VSAIENAPDEIRRIAEANAKRTANRPEIGAYEALRLGDRLDAQAAARAAAIAPERAPVRRRSTGTLEEAQDAVANLRRTFEMAAEKRTQEAAPSLDFNAAVDEIRSDEPKLADHAADPIGYRGDAYPIPGDPYKVPEGKAAGDPYKIPEGPAPIPFRAKAARPLDSESEKSIADIRARIEQNEAENKRRYEAIDAKLTMTMTGIEPPTAAIGAPREPHPSNPSPQEAAQAVAAIPEFRTLRRTLLPNGDVAFSLPVDNVRASIAKLANINLEAFREVGASSRSPVVRITGASDRALDAAMEYARQRWQDDPVVVKVGDKDSSRVIRAAVRAGLNIETAHDPALAIAVAKEREYVKTVEQAFNRNVPSIERAQPQAEMSHTR
jgi:hypothetical protein